MAESQLRSAHPLDPGRMGDWDRRGRPLDRLDQSALEKVPSDVWDGEEEEEASPGVELQEHLC